MHREHWLRAESRNIKLVDPEPYSTKKILMEFDFMKNS